MATTLEEVLERIRISVANRPLGGIGSARRLRVEPPEERVPAATEQAERAPAATDISAAIEQAAQEQVAGGAPAGAPASPGDVTAGVSGPGGFTAESLLAAIRESQELSTGSQLGFAALSGLTGDASAQQKFLKSRRDQAIQEQTLGRKLSLEDIQGTRATEDRRRRIGKEDVEAKRATTEFGRKLTREDIEAGRAVTAESRATTEFRERGQPAEALVSAAALKAENERKAATALREGKAEAAAATARGKPSKFQEKLDETIATQLADWQLKGRATAATSIASLEELVVEITEGGESRVPGRGTGLIPKLFSLVPIVTTSSKILRDRIDTVSQLTLKATLGAQFGEKEGERFLARAFDVGADESENIRRLNRTIQGMKAMVDANEAMLEYVTGPGNGSSEGFEGPTAQQLWENMKATIGGPEDENDLPIVGARASDGKPVVRKPNGDLFVLED